MTPRSFVTRLRLDGFSRFRRLIGLADERGLFRCTKCGTSIRSHRVSDVSYNMLTYTFYCDCERALIDLTEESMYR